MYDTTPSIARTAGIACLVLLSSLTCLASAASAHETPARLPDQEREQIARISTPRREYMIDVGGRWLHAVTFGSGSPAVVLLSGLGTTQDNWYSVIPALAAETTVVTFDRAGVGRSEIGARPAHGEQSAEDLHLLLDRLGVPGPYLVVGHSLGGGVARLFASRYPRDVAGLILEEVQPEDNFDEMRKILKGQDLETLEQAFADALVTPEHPRTEADYRRVTRDQLMKSGPLPHVPFLVLTVRDRALAMKPLFSDAAVTEMARLDVVLMNRLAASVPGGRQIMIEGTGHYVHVDRPQAFLVPALEMLRGLRTKTTR